MNPDYEKITQALNFFARKNSNSRIQKLKAIKLIWAADRYHLRKYGRLLSSDEYVAMKLGPVGSLAKRIAEDDRIWLGDEILDKTNKYVVPSSDNNVVLSKDEVQKIVFSKTDQEALEFAWNAFGDFDGFKIADISHDYPEWIKFKDTIQTQITKKENIDPVDFFENPSTLTILNYDPFEIDEEILESSKDAFIS
jgi:uncharacterized phage-associated protein